MSQKYFVKLEIGNKYYGPTKVSTEGCKDVDDFKKAIKKEWSHTLQSFDAAQLTLFEGDGVTEIDPQTPVSELKEVPWKPMVVTVQELPLKPPSGSSKKQLTYKGLGVEASCRKYFDALARKLALFYDFQWGPDDDNEYPTFGDVLNAYKNEEWSHRYRKKSYTERTDESGFTQVGSQVPILSIRLPDISCIVAVSKQ